MTDQPSFTKSMQATALVAKALADSARKPWWRRRKPTPFDFVPAARLVVAELIAEGHVPFSALTDTGDPHYPDHAWVWADGNYFDAVVIHREWSRYQRASAERWERASE